MRPIKKIGVVGAGAMGQGIAQVCASAAYEVLLFDVNSIVIEKGIQNIANNFELAVGKGKVSDEKRRQALSRIKPATLEVLHVDLIIEAAIEKLEIKQKIFNELEKINDANTVLATNTSSLSITKIASNLKYPGRFVGLHFFNPAHLMKLVEVISGKHTDPNLIMAMVDFAKSIGKIPVVVKDSPGFIVNRVARHYYLESLHLVEGKAADIGTIDVLLRSAGFKLGPFELMDLIGNDVNLEVSRLMYEAFNQTPRFKPSRIQEEKVKDGELGRKTGKGYYDYGKK